MYVYLQRRLLLYIYQTKQGTKKIYLLARIARAHTSIGFLLQIKRTAGKIESAIRSR